MRDITNHGRDKMRRIVVSKIDADFDRVWKEIARERFGKGLDKRYSPTLVQRKTLRHPLFSKLNQQMRNVEFLPETNITKGDFNE